jgi:subtilisin-like proprotein convertase family protein
MGIRSAALLTVGLLDAVATAGFGGAAVRVASGPVMINDNGPATPYPSQIALGGQGSSVLDVNVTLSGLSHNYPDDIDAVLVGPRGQSTMLVSDVGAGADVSGVTLTLDDEAPASMPDETALAAGTFKPTDSDSIGWEPDEMPAPAPTPPIASLAIFDGSDPNGTWSLYIEDDTADGQGALANWSLEIASASSIRVSNARVTEGRRATFRLTRDSNLGQAATASFTAVSGSAKSGRDFKAVSGRVTFAPGESVQRVRVRTREDDRTERTERFFLNVTSDAGTSQGTAKIRDGD